MTVPSPEVTLSPDSLCTAFELPETPYPTASPELAGSDLNAPKPDPQEEDIPAQKTTLCAGIDQRGKYHGLRFDPIEDIGAVELLGKQWVCGECVDRIIAGARPKGLLDERFVTKGRPIKVRETKPGGAVNPKGNGNTGKARRHKRPAWSGR